MAAPENSTMTACNTALIDGFEAIDLETLADELYGKSLIASDVYSGLQLQSRTKRQMSRAVVIGVAASVKTDPKEKFQELLSILRKYDNLKVLVRTLEDTYKEKSKTPATGSHKPEEPSPAAAAPSPVTDTTPPDDEYHQDILKVLNTKQLKDKYEKLKKNISKKGLEKLDEDIESDQHIRLIADKISNWQARSDLLQLSHNPDVQDILGRYGSDPFKQRKYAIIKWKNKVVYPTYHSLLCICIAAQWMESAKVIVEILEKEETDEITDILETKELMMKYKRYKAKIPADKLKDLEEDILNESHLHHIAATLTGWEDKPDLLGLKENPDVQDIISANSDPYRQKRVALERWKNKDLNPTYHRLLCICIAGSWTDTVNQIIQFFK